MMYLLVLTTLKGLPPPHGSQSQTTLLGVDGGQGIQNGAAAPLVLLLLGHVTRAALVEGGGVGALASDSVMVTGKRADRVTETGRNSDGTTVTPHLDEVFDGTACLQVRAVQDPFASRHGSQVFLIAQWLAHDDVGAAGVETLLV